MKNFTYIFMIVLLVIPGKMVSQHVEWFKHITASQDVWAQELAVDDNGYVYVTGGFKSVTNFDQGATNFSLTSSGSNDVFVAKYTPTGDLVWAKKFGGTGNDMGYSIALAGPHVYFGGFYSNTADFDPGPGVYNQPSAGMADGFLCKIDTAGNFAWVNTFGNTLWDEVSIVRVDAGNSPVIAGLFTLSVEFDNVFGGAVLTTSFDSNMFIAKYYTNQLLVWAKHLDGNTGNSAITDLNFDNTGNFYITGSIDGPVDFNPGPSTNTLAPLSASNGFLGKYNSNGNYIWSKGILGTGISYITAIDIDTVGNLYTTGLFNGSIDFDPGTGTEVLNAVNSEDIFVSKLDVLGDHVWTKQIGGSATDYGDNIITDNNGGVYAMGYFKDIVDFDPGPGSVMVSAVQLDDSYILHLNDVGDFLEVLSYGGSGNDRLNTGELNNVGDLIVAGLFTGTADFYPGTGTLSVTSAGFSDSYVMRLSLLTGLDETTSSFQPAIFPNPSTGTFEIYLGDIKSSTIQINLFNSEGKLLKSEHLSTQDQMIYNYNGAPGVYTLEIIQENKIAVRKRIVML